MTDGFRRAPISAVILTFNEELNLAACLESLAGWIEDIFVVDSGSADATVAIAEQYNAHVVVHPFETHAQQWAWALVALPLRTSWVFGLDADQRVTPELRDEILARLVAPGTQPTSEPHGYFVSRRQVFRGRWIRHGGYYPKYLLKLFRREHVRVDGGELVDHHFDVIGAVGTLAGDLIEDNRNEASIAVWTAKHNRYAVLQARQELAQLSRRPVVPIGALFGSPDARTRWLKSAWARLPLFVRPCLYVFYRYVIRLGFLDGKEGFVFHVLQAFWYRLLVDVNIDEIRAAPEPVGENVVEQRITAG
jgi:glycosyltransferase involved in cell wall biosynthesis